MTSSLVHPQQLPQTTRDWAEIQERMLVPLYESVYERLEVGPHTRLLGLGCGSGLALLLAAARGAAVTGTDTDEARLALARARLLPEPQWGTQAWSVRLACGGPEDVPDGPPHNLVTAFDIRPSVRSLAAAAEQAERGSPVVLADWGPAERCAATPALRVAARLAEPLHAHECWRPCGRDDLEEVARRAGLRPDGSGRVACPFGYADLESAVRGLLSTGFYEAAIQATDREQVSKELAEALQPHVRADGTVWLANLFRYVIARV
ncbi:methyltransferase domain-containing protein [Streptomyces gobiensis]|uniref:methyltransferase domain-containing protein n=1 Tax=Streptomyces gobiensis TaxID=2875706 RepID=UPI001E533B2D|nr:methyltransferase domain-containing protein [Streptomyces gobiensis]UGY93826.1 methyltransferase domain-containing protein [Streptomyces gobiensis]